MGASNCATVSAWGISNVGIYGFHIVSNTSSGDIGGVKLAGSWSSPARNIVVAGNLITGVGQDGIKFFNGAKDITVAANVISGTWRQEAIDNVSVGSATFAYNDTSGSRVKYTSLTVKGASKDIEIYGNNFTAGASSSFNPTQIAVGGFGDYRNLNQPSEWHVDSLNYQATRVNVHDNVLAGPNSLVFSGATNSTVTNNTMQGGISSNCGATGTKSICSSNNNTAGAKNGATTGVGPGAMPGSFQNLCP